MIIELHHIPFYVAGIIFSSLGFLVIHIAKRDMEDKTEKDSKKD
jgi:hypothetical protein